MNKWLLGGIITLLLLTFPFYQLYALNNVEMESYDIEQITMNQNLLFVIDGSITLSNPSYIPVTVREIPYVGYIDQKEVFRGSLTGQTIPAGTNATFPFNQEIDWVPDTQTALAILQGEEVTVTIHAKPAASYFILFTIHSEKEVSFDIAEMIQPYVQEQIASMSSLLSKLSS